MAEFPCAGLCVVHVISILFLSIFNVRFSLRRGRGRLSRLRHDLSSTELLCHRSLQGYFALWFGSRATSPWGGIAEPLQWPWAQLWVSIATPLGSEGCVEGCVPRAHPGACLPWLLGGAGPAHVPVVPCRGGVGHPAAGAGIAAGAGRAPPLLPERPR